MADEPMTADEIMEAFSDYYFALGEDRVPHPGDAAEYDRARRVLRAACIVDANVRAAMASAQQELADSIAGIMEFEAPIGGTSLVVRLRKAEKRVAFIKLLLGEEE